MTRLRLYDIRMGRLPTLLGICSSDTTQIAQWVNSAQRRLLTCREGGDEGWHGTFAEVRFRAISRTHPYITCPRQITRIEKLTVCKHAVLVQNQFYEFLDFGNGRMPQRFRENFCNTQAYERNNAITFADLPSPPQVIRLYTTDPAADAAEQTRRVLIQGLDANGDKVYSVDDNGVQIQGEYVTLDATYADTVNSFSSLYGIQKDVTFGNVQFFGVDPVTTAETLFHIMEPGEQVAGYRRYYLDSLPISCCRTNTNTPQELFVTAICKLELIPVVADQDYLLFTSEEAIIEECQSIRYSEMDSERAQKMAVLHHQQAVRFLQGELVHVYGKERPACNFAPFGSARLCRQKIGSLI